MLIGAGYRKVLRSRIMEAESKTPASPAKRVVVAMSGGVDSSVAAALLQQRGHDVIGLFMRNGIRPGDAAKTGKQGCCSLDDARDARRVADRLGIPFYAVNFAADFGRIIDYFVDEYDRGRTPNPCIQCNRWLKFGKLLDYADEIGADGVATGHYGRIVESGDRLSVARAVDDEKDQSYVLYPLTQRQLARTFLPLGELTKDRVRDLAQSFDLPVWSKPDSQEICFVPDNDYGRFLRERNPEGMRPGPILDPSGTVLGEHQGHQLFTIGQRRGFGRSFGRPVYVVAIRPEENAVIIGDSEDLFSTGLVVYDVSWLSIAGLADREELQGEVKIRYRHQPVPATLVGGVDGGVEIRFVEPIRAVTPGQAAVFYRDEAVVCGGFIDAVLEPAPRS